MSCFRPIQGFRTPSGVVFSELSRHDILGPIEIPCGQCLGCRLRRASDWELRVMHEAQMWESNCFVTLTYGRDRLPANGSLEHRDFQLFMKRLRKHFNGRNIRFFMCGEYGPLNQRPHYHACLFNVDFRSDRVPSGKSKSGEVFYSSALLERLWGYGRVSVQDLVKQTAGYTSRYIVSKRLGEDAKNVFDFTDSDGVLRSRRAEYSAGSNRPGIGASWFSRFGRDVFPADYVVSDGVKRRPPKYYDTLYRRSRDSRMDEVEFAREKRAKLALADNTDERRLVREVCAKARLRNSKREVE